MRVIAALLMGVGVAVVIIAFNLDTTVHSPASNVAGSFVAPSDTYNLGLLQRQLMVFQTGLATIIVGAVLYGSSGNSTPQEQKATGDNEAASAERDPAGMWLAGGATVLIIVVGVAIALSGSSPNTANETMNLDENLVAADMNATDMNATDVNATDMNAIDVNAATNESIAAADAALAASRDEVGEEREALDQTNAMPSGLAAQNGEEATDQNDSDF